jgi:hypothetical protein
MWEGAAQTNTEEDFAAAAFRHWYERCEKFVCIGGEYIEES